MSRFTLGLFFTLGSILSLNVQAETVIVAPPTKEVVTTTAVPVTKEVVTTTAVPVTKEVVTTTVPVTKEVVTTMPVKKEVIVTPSTKQVIIPEKQVVVSPGTTTTTTTTQEVIVTPTPEPKVVTIAPEGAFNCFSVGGAWVNDEWIPTHKVCQYENMPGKAAWVEGYWACTEYKRSEGVCTNWDWREPHWAETVTIY